IEYLLGEEQVMVEARHLVDGRTAMTEGGEGIVSYHGLVLDDHMGLDADGCQIESLFIGDLATDPGLMRATVLRDADPSELPKSQTRLCRDLGIQETAILAALHDMRRRHAGV
ncbi:MAG: Hint domain-containing protein, partial [Paracoccaceae bacterium]